MRIAELVERSSAQRAAIAAAAEPLVRKARLLDSALGAARRHPLLLAAAAGALAFAGRRHLPALAGRALALYMLLRR